MLQRRYDLSAERHDLLLVREHVVSALDGAQPKVSAAFDFEVAVEVLDGADDPLALPHARTGAQSYREAFFSAAYRGMRLVSIAPRSAPVDESLELTRDIRLV